MTRKPKLKTLPWRGGRTLITVEEHTASKCSVTKTPMQLDVKVTYIPKDRLLELISFRKYVNYLASKRTYTVESFAEELHEVLLTLLKPLMLKVVVSGRASEHGDVEVVKETVSKEIMIDDMRRRIDIEMEIIRERYDMIQELIKKYLELIDKTSKMPYVDNVVPKKSEVEGEN